MKKNNPENQTVNARECAFKILHKIESRSAYSNIIVDEVIKKNVMNTLDRGFCTQIVYGTLRHKNSIDFIIKCFLDSPERFPKMNKMLLIILRMGILQIMFLDKVPFYSAVDESVKLVRKYGPPGSKGFINGVLRNVCEDQNRSEEDKKIPNFDKMEKIKGLSLKYSHPEWLVKYWLKEFGENDGIKILKHNNFSPPLTIRVNTLKTTVEAVMAALSDLNPERLKLVPEGITVRRAQELPSLSIFKDGHFYIQDETSMLVAHVVDPQPLEVIMDFCASPGGKTTHMGALCNNESLIVAYDRFSHKINKIKENCNRLDVTCVTMKIQDILKLKKTRKAHRILLDVPCSCTGIIRKHPELKWQIQESTIIELAKIQNQILEVGATHLEKNGILVYSACSIEKNETINLIRHFLGKHKEFILDPFPDRVNEWLDEAVREHTGREGYMQFLPHKHGTDGFFMARLKKIECETKDE